MIATFIEFSPSFALPGPRPYLVMNDTVLEMNTFNSVYVLYSARCVLWYYVFERSSDSCHLTERPSLLYGISDNYFSVVKATA